jgi:aminoglycoside phosphotransferase (APT) family kinase protein
MTLAQLHVETQDWPEADDTSPSWMWTPEMTSSAVSFFGSARKQDLADALTRLERESQPLFEPHCWICGDPNPRNWGMRADGSAVLFDWELFGPGSPAMDLAIVVPGLGDLSAFQRVVDGYAAARSVLDGEALEELPTARELALGKAATVVRLLHEHRSGTAKIPDSLLTRVAESFPLLVAKLDQQS